MLADRRLAYGQTATLASPPKPPGYLPETLINKLLSRWGALLADRRLAYGQTATLASPPKPPGYLPETLTNTLLLLLRQFAPREALGALDFAAQRRGPAV